MTIKAGAAPFHDMLSSLQWQEWLLWNCLRFRSKATKQLQSNGDIMSRHKCSSSKFQA